MKRGGRQRLKREEETDGNKDENLGNYFAAFVFASPKTKKSCNHLFMHLLY